MPEQVLFSDSVVRITPAEATFGQISLPMEQIESAKMVAVPPARNYVCNIALGLLILACLFSTTMRWFPAQGDFTMSYVLLDLSRVFMWFFGLGSLAVWLQGTRYLVKLTGSFGEKTVVVARRVRYARKVVSAINAAVKALANQPERVNQGAAG